jgi:hypothetical protein
MKNVTLGLHTLALVSCVLGAVACVAEPAEMSTLPGGGLEPSPDTELLYGLDRADMVRLHSLVSDRFDLDAWLDANRAPFDCGRYGTLCRDVGEEAAYAITEASYLLALDGATIEDVNAYLVPAIVDATGAFAAEAEARGADERLANTCFFTGNANNERLKVTVHAVKPLIGDWHGSADCTYQVKTLGIWGARARRTSPAKRLATSTRRAGRGSRSTARSTRATSTRSGRRTSSSIQPSRRSRRCTSRRAAPAARAAGPRKRELPDHLLISTGGRSEPRARAVRPRPFCGTQVAMSRRAGIAAALLLGSLAASPARGAPSVDLRADAVATGRAIVILRDGAASAPLDGLLAAHGGRVERRIPFVRGLVVGFSDPRTVAPFCDEASRLPGVAAADPDHARARGSRGVAGDPLASGQWYAEKACLPGGSVAHAREPRRHGGRHRRRLRSRARGPRRRRAAVGGRMGFP